MDTFWTNGKPAPECPLYVRLERIQSSGEIDSSQSEGHSDENGQYSHFIVLRRKDQILNINVCIHLVIRVCHQLYLFLICVFPKVMRNRTVFIFLVHSLKATI